MPLEEGVGLIIQGNRCSEPEQILDIFKHLVLDDLLVLEQTIRGSIELHQRHRFKVEFQQFADGAFILHPIPSRQFAARFAHTPNNISQSSCLLRPIKSRIFKYLWQS